MSRLRHRLWSTHYLPSGDVVLCGETAVLFSTPHPASVTCLRCQRTRQFKADAAREEQS